jgi:hypothetical protein
LEELKGFSDLGLFEKSVLQDWSKNWPVKFSNICLNGNCSDTEELDETLTIESLYEVSNDDFELSLKPIKQVFKWNSDVISKKDNFTEKNVNCY